MPLIFSDSCHPNPHSMFKEIFLIKGLNIMQRDPGLGSRHNNMWLALCHPLFGKRVNMFFIVNEIAVLCFVLILMIIFKIMKHFKDQNIDSLKEQ